MLGKTKKETLEHLLVAEMCKASALWSMQENIGIGEYEHAMHFQFMYLYWHDEFIRLMDKFGRERWQLLLRAHGGD